jgi:hypothetical protein
LWLRKYGGNGESLVKEGLNSEVYSERTLWKENKVNFRSMVVKNKLCEKVGATCSMTRGK